MRSQSGNKPHPLAWELHNMWSPVRAAFLMWWWGRMFHCCVMSFCHWGIKGRGTKDIKFCFKTTYTVWSTPVFPKHLGEFMIFVLKIIPLRYCRDCQTGEQFLCQLKGRGIITQSRYEATRVLCVCASRLCSVEVVDDDITFGCSWTHSCLLLRNSVPRCCNNHLWFLSFFVQ